MPRRKRTPEEIARKERTKALKKIISSILYIDNCMTNRATNVAQVLKYQEKV